MGIITTITEGVINNAARALKDGHLVAFPTETVYGLGADATNETAVGRIYSAKGRPANHPVIVHISSIKLLDKWAKEIPEYAINLASEFWPGPMTLILKRSNLAEDFITGGQDNIGLRVPNHSIALAILTEFEKLGGYGIAAPSANRFGAVSPTTAEAVNEELCNFLQIEDLILDGGKCLVGVESTIIDCTKDYPVVLRPGAVTIEMIETITNLNLSTQLNINLTKASGLLESHYSPKAKVIICADVEPGEGFIAMSTTLTPDGVIRLAAPTDIEQYARDLYSAFRDADIKGVALIKIVPPEGNGLAEAIRDRILKASSR
jgi:L-threonylcarbamoyladenylate synthase